MLCCHLTIFYETTDFKIKFSSVYRIDPTFLCKCKCNRQDIRIFHNLDSKIVNCCSQNLLSLLGIFFMRNIKLGFKISFVTICQ